MGSRTSVSLRPAIQATGLLAPAPAGLTPAEHISVTLDARELLKLGIDVAERTVSRLISKRPTPPSQTWAHVPHESHPGSGLDRLLHRSDRSVAGVLRPGRARSPSAAGSALQRHRPSLRRRTPSANVCGGMQIQEVLTAPRSPWQNPFAERPIGSIRRECLNHVLVPRTTPTPNPDALRRPLPSGAHAPRARQGRTRPQANRARSCSFLKSVACTTATSARPRSPAPAHKGSQPRTRPIPSTVLRLPQSPAVRLPAGR
jgi:hypothetical protein